MNTATIATPNVKLPAIIDPPGQHGHLCGECKTRWTHMDDHLVNRTEREWEEAHTCPNPNCRATFGPRVYKDSERNRQFGLSPCKMDDGTIQDPTTELFRSLGLIP